MSDNTQEKNIFIFDAAEGMVLSQDIMTSTGHLIAAKDTVLTLDTVSYTHLTLPTILLV